MVTVNTVGDSQWYRLWLVKQAPEEKVPIIFSVLFKKSFNKDICY